MARTAKKLIQTALGVTATALYTTPVSTTTQITEMWIANTGSTSRTVTLYAHGTSSENMILAGLEVSGNGSQLISDAKIVLSETEVLAAKQDVGTDIILTAYGIEEV